MTDREKLIELLVQAEHAMDGICQNHRCESCPATDKTYCAEALIADHLISNGVTSAKDTDVPSKWISADDRLPDEEQLVLLLCKNGAMFVGYEKYNSYEPEPRWRIKTALNSTKLLNKGRVTHWMPLPEPPID